MSVRNWGPVRDCMQTKVVEVDGRLDVLQAMKVMKREATTSLIVKRRDAHDEYGMVLFSDIAKKVIAKNRAPERVNVYEIMAKPVLTVRPEMEIRYCARLALRRLPRQALLYPPTPTTARSRRSSSRRATARSGCSTCPTRSRRLPSRKSNGTVSSASTAWPR
ncbi:MAG: hypothetical protein P8Y01_11465 [Woeseiaceae bacterium]